MTTIRLLRGFVLCVVVFYIDIFVFSSVANFTTQHVFSFNSLTSQRVLTTTQTYGTSASTKNVESDISSLSLTTKQSKPLLRRLNNVVDYESVSRQGQATPGDVTNKMNDSNGNLTDGNIFEEELHMPCQLVTENELLVVCHNNTGNEDDILTVPFQLEVQPNGTQIIVFTTPSGTEFREAYNVTTPSSSIGKSFKDGILIGGSALCAIVVLMLLCFCLLYLCRFCQTKRETTNMKKDPERGGDKECPSTTELSISSSSKEVTTKSSDGIMKIASLSKSQQRKIQQRQQPQCETTETTEDDDDWLDDVEITRYA